MIFMPESSDSGIFKYTGQQNDLPVDSQNIRYLLVKHKIIGYSEDIKL